MKQYENYKSSGVEFIGDIPEHWEVRKLKHIVKFQNGFGFPEIYQGKNSGDVAFCKVSDINAKVKYINSANNYVSFSEIAMNKWKVIKKNSILMAKIGEALKKNHRKINTIDCLIDNNMLAVNMIDDNLEYLYYLFILLDMSDFSNLGAVPAINMGNLKNHKITLPPLDEQETIAKFLDIKNQQIEEFIKEKEKQIALLKEQKEAIINQAVTKGLDDSVKMKDSGIEWIGDIPEHWEVRKLQFLGQLQNGINIGAEYFGSGYPFVSYVC